MKQMLPSGLGLITEVAVFNILGSRHSFHFDNVEDLQYCILLSLSRGSVTKESTKLITELESIALAVQRQGPFCPTSQDSAASLQWILRMCIPVLLCEHGHDVVRGSLFMAASRGR